MLVRMVDDEELWRSSVPGYGVVRAVVRNGSYAARFDDLNGDGREVCLTLFAWADGRWEPISYWDDTDLPRPDDSALRCAWGGAICAVGRGTPGSTVTTWLDGHTQVGQVDDGGWWLSVVETDEVEELDLWDGSRLWIRYG